MKEGEYIQVVNRENGEIHEYVKIKTVLARYGKGEQACDGADAWGPSGVNGLTELLSRKKEFIWRLDNGDIFSFSFENGNSPHTYTVLDLLTGNISHHEDIDSVSRVTGEKVVVEKHLRQHIRIPIAGRYLVQKTREGKPWAHIYGIEAYKRKHDW